MSSNSVLVNLSDCIFDNYAEIDVIWAKPSINEEIHIIIISFLNHTVYNCHNIASCSISLHPMIHNIIIIASYFILLHHHLFTIEIFIFFSSFQSFSDFHGRQNNDYAIEYEPHYDLHLIQELTGRYSILPRYFPSGLCNSIAHAMNGNSRFSPHTRVAIYLH